MTVTATDTTSASGSATVLLDDQPRRRRDLLGPAAEEPRLRVRFDELDGDGWRHQHRRRSARTPASGTHGWTGTARNHTDTLSQTVTIPAGCHATLSYYLWISSSDTSTTAHDKLTVLGRRHSCAVVLERQPRHGVRAALGRSVGVRRRTDRRIKWRGVENSSLATSFFVDDTALTLS